MFNTNFGTTKCPRVDSGVCVESEKGPTRCQVKNVVYMSVCVLCDQEHKHNPQGKHNGCYIGETSRTLYERVGEHLASLRRWEYASFMFKHWALNHPEMTSPPKFKFSVLKQAQESLAAAMSLSGIITSWADCYKTQNIELQTSNSKKIHFTLFWAQ